MLLPGGGQCQGVGGQWDLDSLLQELMLALVGYTADIFVDSSTDNPRCMRVAVSAMPTHQPVLCVCTSFALCCKTQAVLRIGCLLSCCSSAEIEHPDRCTISLAPDIVLADDVNRSV